MKQGFRRPDGGRVDRARPLNFTFNGKPYQGFAGDTVASALLANGVRVVSRSFKFHRPRGILSAGVEEPNALLGADYGDGMVPIVRATLAPLAAGLVLESQNSFPSVNFDFGRIFDYTRRLWPAGFYNKIFKWPNWHLFEWAVRHTAGLGRLPGGNDSTRYRHLNCHCDVLVVGTGPAGLASALKEASLGNDVIIVEQDIEPGGSLLYDFTEIDGRSSSDWLQATVAELRQSANVRLILMATAVGYYDHNVLTIHDRSAQRVGTGVETFWKVRARHVVLATGAIEQPLLFGNNDRPGIMLASAMHQYANRYSVLCAKQVVGVVNNDLAWQSLFALQDAGIRLKAIVDNRDSIRSELLDVARARGVTVYEGAQPVRARGARGVHSLIIAPAVGKRITITCDGIAMSGGLNPTVHLYSQAGGRLKYEEGLACFVPNECQQAVEMVGAANGEFATQSDYNIAPRQPAPFDTSKQWVDYLHDVVASDIELAVRENYISVEHLKRYTTTGMSVDQGKTSNVNALSLLAIYTNRTPGEVGTTTFRPQFMPVTLGAIGGNRRGERYAPTRLLPAHNWHVANGAVFDEFGGWQRPAYYGDDMDESIRHEVSAVRNAAGLFDGSPLGKIEVRGPDAAEFLNRIYVNTVLTLKVGKVRYGLMLNENGIIIDDGVFVRIAEEHFVVNTSSANAERIAAWLEEWHQCEWPSLDLVISPVSSQWAVATVAGPNARLVLESLPGIVDLTTDMFPHMSFVSGMFDDGTPYRLQRVSYSGEQSYELSVPSSSAVAVYENIMSAGSQLGLVPFGVEALAILRLEKGFLHVGGDTDGSTNALDVGFGRVVDNKEMDFIGARSLQRSQDQRDDRRQLVGIEPVGSSQLMNVGAHVVTGSGDTMRSEGFVTSSAMSPTLGRRIGLGLVENGFARLDDEVEIFDDGELIKARIVSPCYYDPDGERMRD